MADQNHYKVAVFDINGTLYRKSSKEEFFKYICFKKGYKLLNIFQLIIFKIIGKARLINQTEFKENFFNYLDNLSPEAVKKYAQEYWHIEFPQYFNEKLMKRVEELKKENVKVICISGGLDVYMRPLFERFDVDHYFYTKTKYVNNTYKIDGQACKGEEKVRCLDNHFGNNNYTIVEAYSDDPEVILDHAEKAYLITPEGEIKNYKPDQTKLAHA
ncbi:HAD superfamily phosphoserine phosphatase-like hydrolase [Catalinimonas alkaloidigena]|uniref:HAD family hydrolase n=1 Tax=Catalinimonas alkaloidigena TaxID=1075417 RepID=UPI002404C2A4|nr:HAD family hydrolase [Catalinimonas alkaloidigena]MDF9796164.1 HAD superfamily phosphoserine phosphatase-like hydrolase [Catalinimonas alkaloidigena]